MDTKELKFLEVEEDDISILTPIMKRAFDRDGEIHLGTPCGPPGYDNGEFIKRWCFHDKATAYKILLDDIVIGSFNLFINEKSNINILGMLFIDSEFHGQGIGTKVWKLIEEKYPTTNLWKTETIWYSLANHYFYVTKCGFNITSIENHSSTEDAQYYMEKVMK